MSDTQHTGFRKVGQAIKNLHLMVWIYHSLVIEGLKKLTEIFPEWVANPGPSVLDLFQILLYKLVMQCVPTQ